MSSTGALFGAGGQKDLELSLGKHHRAHVTPVRHHPRVRGVSKYNLWRIPKVLLDLTTVKFLRDFYVTPIYFFGWMGILGLGVAALTLAGAGVAAIWSATIAAVLGIGAVLMGMLGIIEITLGIIAEVLIRMHYDIRDKAPYRIRQVRNLDTSEEVVSRVGT